MDISLIEPSKKTIREIFDGSHAQLQIPKYQRSYSWDKDNAERFYEDIFGTESTYFLGSIVLTKREDDILEVIDGQQRLTTSSLFLLSLYLYCREFSPEDASEVLRCLKKGSFTQKINSLVLNRINNDVYKCLIDATDVKDIKKIESKSDSDKALISIVQYFYERIVANKINDLNQEKKRIEKIYKDFSDRVFFLVIMVKDVKKASRLFEILNNRGVELTDADLIRNYILLKSDYEAFTAGLSTWESIENKIGIDNLEQFFRYSSFLVDREGSIYERIVTYTDNNSATTIINFLNDISDTYLQIVSPNDYGEADEKVASALDDLNSFGVTQIRSILMASKRKFSVEEFEILVDNLLRFIFRYSIVCGKNPNKIENLSQDLAYKIFNSSCTLNEVLAELKKFSPLDEEFAQSFRNRDFKNHRICRYIIARIENYISPGDKNVAMDSVHLEHIMPKKIDKWQKSDKYYSDDFHASYLYKLGNMVLLQSKINTKIKNDIFELKKNKYEGDINLLQEVKNASSWKKEEIESNTERYLKYSQEIWKR